ncbi:MAG: hypothetical protein GY869_09175, partial [Planctomycetes bacterium]|nr:hypothetical protein [Planctomycetota bacterium]
NDPDESLLDIPLSGNGQVHPTQWCETIILTHSGQLARRFGSAQRDAILAGAVQLADTLNINGLVVDLADVVSPEMYQNWADGGYVDYDLANAISQEIRAHLNALYDIHTSRKHVVIIGDDTIVPHRRVADLAPIYQEHLYASQVANSSFYNTLANDLFLSDDFYAARGDYEADAVYFYPSFAVGRLVGDEQIIVSQIERFISSNGIINVTVPSTNFGTRYYYNDGLSVIGENFFNASDKFDPFESYHIGP